MTKVRRLVSVGAFLALAALITLSQVWGEPGRDKELQLRPGSNPADRGGFTLAEDLALTKFTDQPVTIYRTKEGETLFALQALAVHWRPLQRAFGTVALTATDWAVCLAVSSSVVWLGEVRKLLRRRGRSTRARRLPSADG